MYLIVCVALKKKKSLLVLLNVISQKLSVSNDGTFPILREITDRPISVNH